MRSDPDVENFTSSAASLPRTFRARPEFVRCCVYLMVGGWISIGLAFAVRQQPWVLSGVAIGISILCLAPLLLVLYVSTYRIVLDERGIARRRLFWWTLWPWEDLAAGHIRRSDTGYTLIHRQRPWWDRWLVPDLLPSDEIRFLLEVVAETSLSQAAQTKPVHEMRLKWHVFPQPLLINQAGCQLASEEWLLWENIVEFRLQDSRNEGKTLRRLCITMRDGTCHSKLLREVAWNETTIVPDRHWDLTWIAVLQSIVPARCWKHFRLEGELQSVEEGDYRLHQNASQAQATRVLDGFAVLFVALQVARIAPNVPRFWNDPFLGLGWKILIVVLTVTYLSSLPGLLLAMSGQKRKRLRASRLEIEQQIAAVSETSASAVAGREFGQQMSGEAAARKPNFSISPA
jgi:hypothetical protein